MQRPTRSWYCQRKLHGYLVCLEVFGEEYNEFIDYNRWITSPHQQEMLLYTIQRLQRKAVEDMMPFHGGRYKCDWEL